MKRLFILCCLLPFLSPGQALEDGKINMTTTYGSKIPELRDVLNFENIDYFNVQFSGNELKGKDYLLIVKELWDGEVKDTDTLVNTSENKRLNALASSDLKFTVTAKKSGESTLKIQFKFPQFGMTKSYKATNSEDYSLRDVGTNLVIEEGKSFAAFAYILPYEKDGWKMWCAVDSSGKDIESWGHEFGLKHYLIFEMQFH